MTAKLICVACCEEEAAQNSMYCFDCEFAKFLVDNQSEPGLWAFEPVRRTQESPDYVYRVLGLFLLVCVAVLGWVAFFQFGGWHFWR